jgi:hypothetical protein
MEGAPTRRIIEVVNKCPTQAIVWKYNKDLSEAELQAQHHVKSSEENPQTLSKNEDAAPAKTRVKPTNVRIMKDGPIVVDGDFKVIGRDEEELKKSIMTSFCRCGSSKDMPFCDGTHRKKGFTDE